MTTELITLAQQLLSLPSITPDDAGCQALIRERLELLGFHCECLRFGEVDNLWARLGSTSPLLVFAGHTDVVPPGPDAAWTSPPFEPAIRDGYLYGRGAADMKAAIAAMLLATEKFLKSQANFSGSIGFLFTSDEEGPADNGTVKVMETLQKRGEKLIIASLVNPPAIRKWVINSCWQTRFTRCKLIVQGKQGHVAYPALADNPIHQALSALHELASTEWDQGNEFYPPTTFQISNIHAGTGAGNVIPGELEILCNFRFGTALTAHELQKRSEIILNKHKLKFTAAWHESAKPFLTKKGKLVSATEEAIREITGLTTVLSTAGGTSDGRFIAPTGTEVVELGTSNATAHHVNEGVKTDDLILLEKIYHEILVGIFK